VYLNIGDPISARTYIDTKIRTENTLLQNAKLPIQIAKNMAYSIIDCQKRNTILSPFNLISILYNDRVYSFLKESYSLDDLLQDYSWIKNILITKFKISVNPIVSR
jgi:hypothetical protein